jgi:ribosome-binding factor A
LVSKQRAERIADRLRDELSEMMIHEIQDPRLTGVSVTGAHIDRELAFADIYVSAVEGSQRAEEILAGLNHATGFIRSELARRIDLRTFPRLRFHWDPTFERGERIDQLIASLEGENPSYGETPQDAPEEDSAQQEDEDEVNE